MRVRRWPALVLVPASLVGAVLYDRENRPAPEVGIESRLPSSISSVQMDRPSSWFCIAGREIDGHAVAVVNIGTSPAAGTITVFGDGLPGQPAPVPVVVDVTIQPGELLAQPLGELIEGSVHTAATVELAGGETVVTHSVFGVNGVDTEPCANRGTDSWYEPWATTVLGATATLVMFNPFPEDAVIDVTFATENTVREPRGFQNVVVPARSIVPLAVGGTAATDAEALLEEGQIDEDSLDLGGPVTVAERVSATVTVRSGRVYVERIQDLEPEDSGGLQGLLVGVPASDVAEAWLFPTGRLDELVRSRVIVYNPGEELAEVDVEVITDSGDTPVEPFQLSVLPRRSIAVDLDVEARMAGVVGFSLLVRSVNGVEIVASRVDTVLRETVEAPPPTTTTTTTTTTTAPPPTTVDPDTPTTTVDPDATTTTAATTTTSTTTTTTEAPRPIEQPGGTASEIVPGVAVTHGVSTLAGRQVLVVVGAIEGQGSEVVLVNPSFDGPAEVTLGMVSGGLDDPITVVVAAGRRLAVALDDLGTGTFAVLIESSRPVAAELEQFGLGGRTLVPTVPAGRSLAPIPRPI